MRVTKPRYSNRARILQSYRNAKERCENSSHKQYPDYGGRGIRFLFTSVEELIQCTEGTYARGLTLERKDNSGNYECGNTRWATQIEQASNKRNNVRIEFKGQTRTIAEWARHFDVSYATLYKRLNKQLTVTSVLTILEFECKSR